MKPKGSAPAGHGLGHSRELVAAAGQEESRRHLQIKHCAIKRANRHRQAARAWHAQGSAAGVANPSADQKPSQPAPASSHVALHNFDAAALAGRGQQARGLDTVPHHRPHRDALRQRRSDGHALVPATGQQRSACSGGLWRRPTCMQPRPTTCHLHPPAPPAAAPRRGPRRPWRPPPEPSCRRTAHRPRAAGGRAPRWRAAAAGTRPPRRRPRLRAGGGRGGTRQGNEALSCRAQSGWAGGQQRQAAARGGGSGGASRAAGAWLQPACVAVCIKQQRLGRADESRPASTRVARAVCTRRRPAGTAIGTAYRLPVAERRVPTAQEAAWAHTKDAMPVLLSRAGEPIKRTRVVLQSTANREIAARRPMCGCAAAPR